MLPSSSVPLVVAIDGPAGSGKTTLASRLANEYELNFLDTGLLYRAVGRALLDTDASPGDEPAAIKAAEALTTNDLAPERLFGETVGAAASKVASLPGVRAALLPVQRRLARQGRGSVVVGRDIGSVVLPDSPLKFFITASLPERARRRTKDLQARGQAPIEAEVLADLEERDRRDAARAVAPLVVPPDAIELDTSQMTIDEVLSYMRKAIDQHLADAGT